MASKSPGQKRKQMILSVLMLDDTEIPFQIDFKLSGNEFVNVVYEYLKLVESDYFGLEYFDAKGKKCWLDHDKPVSRQVQNDGKLIFGVKFYTPDPGQLEEEYTRYLYALQIKRDLAEGSLLCSDATASLLVSYILQAEIGDYLETFNDNSNYFNNKRYFLHQTEDHTSKIIDYHKNHIGQTPADADLNLLDIARKVELYGVIMHPAKDHEGVQLNLAIAHMGILVFQNFTKINTFSWAKIRKLSFKRKKFLVKLHSENCGFYKDTVEFYFDNRDDSKGFWKKCIEHHSFFRCLSITHMPRQKHKLFATRGSSFRYYGRTQKELIESARENFSKNRIFDRSYHSIRSIGTGSGAGNGHINGTQSLNRNLASRSAGALMIASNGCGSSTLSSNDSDQNYNLGSNQNTSSSAHHLSYTVPKKANENIKNNESKMNEAVSMPFLNKTSDSVLNGNGANNNSNSKKSRLRSHLQDDTSTHGSRTIDSRHSNDKTLGLSDGENENDEDDEEDDDYEGQRLMPEEENNREDNREEAKLPASDACDCGDTSCDGPIQIQRVPSEIVKLPIRMNTGVVTNTEPQQLPIVSTNPNKIYSRKEVITTSYKEEVKNTHLEEYHHMTTFFDNKEGLSSSSSLLTTVNPQHQPIYIELNKDSRNKPAVSDKQNIKPYGTATGRNVSSFQNQTIEKQTKKLNNYETEDNYANNKIGLNDDNVDDNDDQGKRLNPLDSNKLSSSSIISSSEYVMIEKNAENINNNNNTKVLLPVNVGCNATNNLNKNFCKDMKTGDGLVDFDDSNNNNNNYIINKQMSDVSKHRSGHQHHKHRCHKNPDGENLTKEHKHHHNHHSCHKHNSEHRRHKRKKQNKEIFCEQPTQPSEYTGSLKKLTKTPVFLTSNDPVNIPRNKSASSSKKKGLILITATHKKNLDSNKKNKLTNDFFNFMSIDTDSDYGKKENTNGGQTQNFIYPSSTKVPRDLNHDLTFSLSSSQSASSLSYLKDLPIQFLTSSSSSDFSFITRSKESSSSSINLSPLQNKKNSQKLISSSSSLSSQDSLKISMIELNKLSHNLNKKILKLKSSNSKKLVAISDSSNKKKHEQQKGLILDESKTLPKQRKHRDHNQHQSQENNILISKISTHQSLTRPHKYIEIIDLSKKLKSKSVLKSRSVVTSDLILTSGVSGQPCTSGEFRKVVNKFNVNEGGTMLVNGSTPIKRPPEHLTVEKKLIEERSSSSRSSSEIQEQVERKENLEQICLDGDYDLVAEEVEQKIEQEAVEEDTTTIREILEKIVESKLQIISSIGEKCITKVAVKEVEADDLNEKELDDEILTARVQIKLDDEDEPYQENHEELKEIGEKVIKTSDTGVENGSVGEDVCVVVEDEDVVVDSIEGGLRDVIEESSIKEVVEEKNAIETDQVAQVFQTRLCHELGLSDEIAIEESQEAESNDVNQVDQVSEAENAAETDILIQTAGFTEINNEILEVANSDHVIETKVITQEVPDADQIGEIIELGVNESVIVVEEAKLDEIVILTKADSPIRKTMSDNEMEARIIKKTVYKVLEKASEIVAAEYNLEKSVRQQQKQSDLDNN